MTRLPVHRAFSLVELLVVVSVVTLLIALLLPVIGKSRELARTVNCASNLRQLHQAFLAYANDYGGKYPDTGLQAATPGGNRDHMLYVWEEKLAKHLRDRYLSGTYRVMLCPSAMPSLSESWWEHDTTEGGSVWTSYASFTSRFIASPMNVTFAPSVAGEPLNSCRKISSTPPEFALLTDNLYHDVYAEKTSGSTEWLWWKWTPMHPGNAARGFYMARGANVLRADGGASWRDIDATRARLRHNFGSSYREYLW